ncbi:hypothetical protein [Patulibacter sp. SYSU D01012]|uniref:hypothetical protein n=1 Tax=Patulibacter sp. SYSU D01012 TaxID=2817381 RepID=UPI001B3172E9|nr:hypothetical protein [Patulibacter sp. SYSU D01012]
MTGDDRPPLGAGWLVLRVVLGVLLVAALIARIVEGDGTVAIVLSGILALAGAVQGWEALLALTGHRDRPVARETTGEWLRSVLVLVLVMAAAFALGVLL